jgi:ketosteroid isomerase-like protein
MPSRSRVLELVRLVEAGRITNAITEFYADNVAMQENLSAATVGKQANLERERRFFDSITINQMRALSVVVDGDSAAINWLFEYTTADGQRYRMDEVAVQTWEGDRIVHERFVYDTATLAAA